MAPPKKQSGTMTFSAVCRTCGMTVKDCEEARNAPGRTCDALWEAHDRYDRLAMENMKLKSSNTLLGVALFCCLMAVPIAMIFVL